jgi:hypothetical protein
VQVAAKSPQRDPIAALSAADDVNLEVPADLSVDNLRLPQRTFLVDPKLHIRRSTQVAQDRSHT